MRIHCLQHSENPGHTHLDDWALRRGHAWTCTILPPDGELPRLATVDCLIVVGGPMSVWEEQRHPWLRTEKRFVEACIKSGRPVLGICLGAQLLADVLGARTYKGPHKEIGWFDVETTPEGRNALGGKTLPERFETFLWHGDTFDLPQGALRIARSEAFENQGFIWNRTLALQFHLEVRPAWVEMLANRDARELVEDTYVQSAPTVLGKPESLYRYNNALMDELLSQWLGNLQNDLSGEPHSRHPPL